MAAPFVQGKLTGNEVDVEVHTECAHCGEALELTVDAHMRCTVHTPGADPVVSIPLVDPARIRAPNILDDL